MLRCFIAGGDTSALGVAQAVTAAAQSVESGDRAYEMEAAAFDIATGLVAAN